MTTDEDEMAGTTADDYARAYYDDPHLGSYGDYSWDSDEWRGFFTMVADRIIGLTGAKTTLDVGCAKGLLVQALAHRGVDSRGIDLSEYAIESAHPDVRPRLTVASAAEPLGGRFDLITCVEVLEHMDPAEAQKAIDMMCNATDRILFSSSPGDHQEPTHVNTHPTAQWAAWFAERGFFRRPESDATFLAGWAILFERSEPTVRDLVERYERLVAPLQLEVTVKRNTLLETQRRLDETVADSAPAARVVDLDDEAILARHRELTAVDHVIGLEARVSVLAEQNRVFKHRISLLRERIARLQRRAARPAAPAPTASLSRRVGRAVRRRTGGAGR